MYIKIIVFYTLFLCSSVSLIAQYKAIDINSNFLSISAKEELEESGSSFRRLSSSLPIQKTIGYSIPVTKDILITPKLGYARSHNNYTTSRYDSLLVGAGT